MPLLNHRLLVLLLLSIVGLSPSVHAEAIKEEHVLLPVSIDGREVRLEALIVRPDKVGRFPIALIVNGSSGAESRAEDFRADWLGTWAHDFAYRGWLAASILWRGYGRSDGPSLSYAGSCDSPDSKTFFKNHADDLDAALKTLTRRPDADGTRTLGIGLSIGGASMLALAARLDHPLGAVINVSGGLYKDALPFKPNPKCAGYEAEVVRNFATFGASFHGPTLWLYAENDPWFRPEWVELMRSAYVGAGGQADFTGFPPFGKNGHEMFTSFTGKSLLIPKIDGFLQRNRLPGLDETRFIPILAELSESDRSEMSGYLLAQPAEKALAVAGNQNGLFWSAGWASLDDARLNALHRCRMVAGDSCRIVLEDFDQVAPLPQRRANN